MQRAAIQNKSEGDEKSLQAKVQRQLVDVKTRRWRHMTEEVKVNLIWQPFPFSKWLLMQSAFIFLTRNLLSLRHEILTYAYTLILRNCRAILPVFKAVERISVTKITEEGQRNADICMELAIANYKSFPSWSLHLIEHYNTRIAAEGWTTDEVDILHAS